MEAKDVGLQHEEQGSQRPHALGKAHANEGPWRAAARGPQPSEVVGLEAGPFEGDEVDEEVQGQEGGGDPDVEA